MIVRAAPVAGRDDDFNRWYDERHLVDLLAIPGIISARRFELAAEQLMPVTDGLSYLAIYQIETDDLAGVIAEIKGRIGTGRMPRTDAMGLQQAIVVSPITGLVVAAD